MVYNVTIPSVNRGVFFGQNKLCKKIHNLVIANLKKDLKRRDTNII